MTLNTEQRFLQSCEEGVVDDVVHHVQLGVDVNCVDRVDGNTGLMLASRDNRLEVASVLLGLSQTDLNKVNKFGYTALMLAAQSGHLAMMDLLLGREDINLDLTNKAGRRAEECARRRNRDTVLEKISMARESIARKRKIHEEEEHPEAPLMKVERRCQSMFTGEANTGGENLTIRNILTARLENCLIDLGSKQDNILLCTEMLNMAKKLQLQELQSICKRSLIDHMTADTVFEILQAVEDDLEMKEMCLNFIVTNIDDMRLADSWRENLRKCPDISIDLIDRL